MVQKKQSSKSRDQADWRLQNALYLSKEWTSPTGQTSPKGSQLTLVTLAEIESGKIVRLPLPNATALMLNSSRRTYLNASTLRNKNKIDKSKNMMAEFGTNSAAFEYLGLVMESVLTAHAGLEAFVNDQIPENYQYISNRRSKIILEASDKETIQRRYPLSEKISLVLPEILNVQTPKGNSDSWEAYKKLEKLRNRITHMKSEDRKSAQADMDTLWHALVKACPPYKQALSVIKYFSKHLENTPRWLRKCPRLDEFSN